MASINFPLQFQRQYAGAIDVDQVFETTLDRINYLSNARRYEGQIVYDKQTKLHYYLKSDNTWGQLSVSGTLGSVSASDVSFDNTNTGLSAINVQSALIEISPTWVTLSLSQNTTNNYTLSLSSVKTLMLMYYAQLSTDFRNGTISIFNDGTTPEIDDEYMIEGNLLENELTFSTNLASGNLRLNIATGSIGSTPIDFKYSIVKKL